MADRKDQGGMEATSSGRKAEEVTRTTKPLHPPTQKQSMNKKIKPSSATVTLPAAHITLLQLLSEHNYGLDEQLFIFMSAVTMSAGETQLRHQVLEDLKMVLLSEFPEVRLHPFGSLITGLGDNDSDLDIYIDCTGSTRNGHINQGMQNRRKKEVEFNTVHSILRRLGRKQNKVFYHIIEIPSARVPIIKAIHWRTGISCDLSFENFLSVRNSRLIKLYTKIHPSVRPLMCLIRYWGKFYELTDSTKIKNYGLCLLILVYLIRDAIIPSIYELQLWTPKQSRCRIEDWDASFLENEFILLRKLQEVHGILPPVSCRMILQLMLGFCKLYSSFNASTDVVCTLTADFLPRRQFCPGYEQELPPELNDYKEWCYGQETKDRLNVSSERPFIVQDPFVLNYNVSGVTSSFSLQRFQCACEGTAVFLQKFLNSSAAELKTAKLMDIFYPIQFPKKQTADATKKALAEGDAVSENVLPGDKSEQKQMGFSSRPTPEYYEVFFKQFGSCGFPHEEIHFRANATWIKFVKEFFQSFFRCYSFDVETTLEFLPRKQPLWPPKRVNHDGEANTETNLIPKVRTKPRHVQRMTELQSSRNPILSPPDTFPNDTNSIEEENAECTLERDRNGVDETDDGASSDDSSLSLSTIELISAIIRNPSPRELLDAINVTEYTPQRLTFRFNGNSPNVWDRRGIILSQLTAEKWKTVTGDPIELEAEITRRLAAKEESENQVSFDCTVTLRPDNYKTVYAEVQFRESQGFRVISILKALKTTMSSILTSYVMYRYAHWTERLPTSFPSTAGPSCRSSISIPLAQQMSQPKQKLKVRKVKPRKPVKLSASSAGQLETGPPQVEAVLPEPNPPQRKEQKRGKLVSVN